MAEVARLALLGTVSTMTVDEKGRPLNLGRKQRLATADQWIALTVRDGGCVAPGCDRPAGWCQAHHLKWWERDGGFTDLANLALACSHHHHLIHDGGWTLDFAADGTWQLTRPDGTGVDAPRYRGEQRPPQEQTTGLRLEPHGSNVGQQQQRVEAVQRAPSASAASNDDRDPPT